MPLSSSLQSTYTLVPGTFRLGTVDRGVKEISTLKNADVVSIPLGSPVSYKPSAATSDIDVVIPATVGAVLAGVVMHSDDYARAWTDNNGTFGELDSVGVVVASTMQVLRLGRIWVTCTNGCTPGQRLFVSFAAGAVYTAKGQMGSVTDTSVLSASQGKGEWLTTATALGAAWLDIDMTNNS